MDPMFNLEPVTDANDIFFTEGLTEKRLGMAERWRAPEDDAIGELVPADHAMPRRELREGAHEVSQGASDLGARGWLLGLADGHGSVRDDQTTPWR
jgi:hypothetical protein